jgi:hypothetical protein
MTTLSNGTATITPTLVDGYSAGQEARTIAHPIISRPGPDDVTLRPAGPRTGILRLLFATEADAEAARALHAAPYVWTLTDADLSSIGMDYVVEGGTLGAALEDETRELWLLEIPFREV